MSTVDTLGNGNSRKNKRVMMHPCKVVCVHLVLCLVLVNGQTDRNDAKYIIVGGGLAGLSAAKQLTDQGESDFLILEADSRIGGRVKSVQFGGTTVEVGAQWLNSLTSEVGKLAKKAGVTTKTSDYDSFAVRDNLGADLIDAAYDRYDAFGEAFDSMNKLSEELGNKKYKPDISQRAALALGGWNPRTNLDYAIEYYDHDFVYGHGTETASTRYSYIPSLGNLTGYTENVVIDQTGGLEKIVELLRQEALGDLPSRLKLYEKVSKITYDESGATLTMDGGGSYTCDYVILTVSLGVLKNNGIEFDPPLPEWKSYSIAASTFVVDIPVYAHFPSATNAFWDDYEYILHAGPRRNYYTLWQNFHQLIPGSGILQIQMSGEEAKRVSEASGVAQEISDVLAGMYSTSSEPTVLVPDWFTNPLYYGTYSDRSPSFTHELLTALKAPVGPVYFAGEAYHEYFGYMEGAYGSGKEVINEILECQKAPDKCVDYEAAYENVGCTYSSADNYKRDSQIDDGSCTFSIEGVNSSSTDKSIMLWVFISILSSVLFFH